MKKVLMAFLGLVLLSQIFTVWERGHERALLHRHAPAQPHQTAPHKGGGENHATVMFAIGSVSLAGQTSG